MRKGRPRTFDLETALNKAMKVFWEKGYEGTSLPDLTEAMGISRPSLYAAFGNKESLFLKVLDLYRADPASYVNRALEESTVREVLRSLFYGVIDLLCDPENPGGCLFVNAALACGDTAQKMQSELVARRLAGERDILQRFERAADEGALPAGATPERLAKFAATMIWGLSVQAVNGCSRAELIGVADTALSIFPDDKNLGRRSPA